MYCAITDHDRRAPAHHLLELACRKVDPSLGGSGYYHWGGRGREMTTTQVVWLKHGSSLLSLTISKWWVNRNGLG